MVSGLSYYHNFKDIYRYMFSAMNFISTPLTKSVTQHLPRSERLHTASIGESPVIISRWTVDDNHSLHLFTFPSFNTLTTAPTAPFDLDSHKFRPSHQYIFLLLPFIRAPFKRLSPCLRTNMTRSIARLADFSTTGITKNVLKCWEAYTTILKHREYISSKRVFYLQA